MNYITDSSGCLQNRDRNNAWQSDKDTKKNKKKLREREREREQEENVSGRNVQGNEITKKRTKN
jgi:hypothetical protein